MPHRIRPEDDEIIRYLGATTVRVRDLEALGLNRSAIGHRCRPGGPWRRVVPGIVRLHNGPGSRDDRRRAALLHCGAPAVITGADALDLHGIRAIPAPHGPVHTLIPTGRRRVGGRIAVAERTDRLPVASAGRWPLAPVQRAALDFARRGPDRDQVRSVLAELVQRGLCTPLILGAELAAGAQRGSALPRLVLREIGDGVRSAAEAEARRLLRGSGLPVPLWNARLYDQSGRFLATPDAWFDDCAVAWEIDSRAWHLSPRDHERTVARHTAMTAAGVLVLHTLPATIHAAGPAVLDDLRATLHHAAARPRPPLLAVPADHPGARTALS